LGRLYRPVAISPMEPDVLATSRLPLKPSLLRSIRRNPVMKTLKSRRYIVSAYEERRVLKRGIRGHIRSVSKDRRCRRNSIRVTNLTPHQPDPRHKTRQAT